MKDKFNKGEWSEFYAFLKILQDKRLTAATADLEPIADVYYPVLAVLRDTKGVQRRYTISNKNKINVNIGEGLFNQNFDIEGQFVDESVEAIFKAIKGSSGSFSISESHKIISTLKYGDVKAKSSKKGDITLVIHNAITQQENKVDFSIKSYAGATPTLLNASGATRFRYRVNGYRGAADDINSINPRSAKVQARLGALIGRSDDFTFAEMVNKNFESNLIKVDSAMPLFIAEYLKFYYQGYGNSLDALTKLVVSSPSIKSMLPFPVSYEDLKYKIKQLLLNVALGLVPSKRWDGFLKADGGYIVVKETGDVVCFHVYNTAELGEYLFQNTRFDTGSTTKHKFAKLFQGDDKKWYFDLNIQISFSK